MINLSLKVLETFAQALYITNWNYQITVVKQSVQYLDGWMTPKKQMET